MTSNLRETPGDSRQTRSNVFRGKTMSVLRYLQTTLSIAVVIITMDSLVLLLVYGLISRPVLALTLFLEAGAGLLIGVVISMSSTPSLASIGHVLLGTASWSRESEKHAEKVGLKWFITSAFLLLIGFMLSSL